jgi:hypothetical protein
LFRATEDSGAIFGSVARAAIGELDASEQPGETSDVFATLRRSFSWEAPMSTDFVFTNYRSIFAVVGLLACLAASPAAAQNISWPAFGPERSLPRLDGLTDALPDFVGPLDGSAELTIFTEGNHYPVLLPLVLDAFPAWCKDSGACAVDAGKILIVTCRSRWSSTCSSRAASGSAMRLFPLGAINTSFPTWSWAERGRCASWRTLEFSNSAPWSSRAIAG